MRILFLVVALSLLLWCEAQGNLFQYSLRLKSSSMQNGVLNGIAGVAVPLRLVTVDADGFDFSICPEYELKIKLTHETGFVVPADGILDCLSGERVVSYIPTVSGNYKLDVGFDTKTIENSPFTMVVKPAERLPTAYHAFIEPAYVGIPITQYYRAADQYHNFLLNCDGLATETVIAQLEGDTSFTELDDCHVHRNEPVCVSSVIRPRQTQPAVEVLPECQDATRGVRFMTTLSGRYTLALTIDFLFTFGSPYSLNVFAGPLSPAHTIVFGHGLKSGNVFTPLVFRIQAKDERNNDRTIAGDEFRITIAGPLALDSQNELLNELRGVDRKHEQHIPQITYLGNGLYEVQTAVDFEGEYELYVRTPVGPDAINVHLLHSPFYPVITAVEFAALGEGTRGGDAGEFPHVFDLVQSAGQCNFEFYFPKILIEGPGNVTFSPMVCQSGVYTIRYVGTRSGAYSLSILVAGQHVAASPYTLELTPGSPVPFHFLPVGKFVTTGVTLLPSVFNVTARDRFSNQVDFCGSSIEVEVEMMLDEDAADATPAATPAPTPAPTSAFSDTGDQQIEVEAPVVRHLIPATVGDCTNGVWPVEYLPKLDGEYMVSIFVDGFAVNHSPFLAKVGPVLMSIRWGVSVQSTVPLSRFSYYQVVAPLGGAGVAGSKPLLKGGRGFQILVEQTAADNVQAQPWVIAQHERLPDDLDPVLDLSLQKIRMIRCTYCRLHVPPVISAVGTWTVGVYGWAGKSDFKIRAELYDQKELKEGVTAHDSLEAGFWSYYEFEVRSRYGFMVEAKRTAGKGFLAVVLKKGSYPMNEDDASSTNQPLRQKDCVKCRISHVPSSDTTPQDKTSYGRWYLGVFSLVQSTSFDIKFQTFKEEALEFGQRSTQGSVAQGAWMYYKFFIPGQFSGFEVQVVPGQLKSELPVILKHASHPLSVNDSHFPHTGCPKCRVQVRSTMDFFGWWYIGIYGQKLGGSFVIKILLLTSCYNDCSGNGYCVEVDFPICVCFPGYRGPHCADAVGAKMDSWYLLRSSFADLSGNHPPLDAIRNDGQSELSFSSEDVLSLRNSFVVGPAPKPGLVCHDGFSAARFDRDNLIGCQEYSPYKELTVMGRFRAIQGLPATGSGIGLGRYDPNGILPALDSPWSWIVSPIPHPSSKFWVLDFIVNDPDRPGHKYSVREGQPFPDWPPQLVLDTWYHIVVVFRRGLMQLIIDGNVIRETKIPEFDLMEIENSWVHIGHDPRFNNISQLFFGDITDVRILKYAASLDEIREAYRTDLSMFDFEEKFTQSLVDWGSVQTPMNLLALEDGSVPTDVFNHHYYCTLYRPPNEQEPNMDMFTCNFDGSEPGFVFKRNPKKHSTQHVDISNYGMGHFTKVINPLIQVRAFEEE